MITVNFEHRIYGSLPDRPAAPVFGAGTCTVAGVDYVSDGETWSVAEESQQSPPATGIANPPKNKRKRR